MPAPRFTCGVGKSIYEDTGGERHCVAPFDVIPDDWIFVGFGVDVEAPLPTSLWWLWALLIAGVTLWRIYGAD